jgi:potassium efflux system protein
MFRLFRLFLIGIIMTTGLEVRSQQTATDTLKETKAQDSVISPYVERILEAGARDKRKSEATYVAGKTAIRQRIVWEALIRTAQEVKLYLDNGINLKGVKDGLGSVRQSFTVVQDGIFNNKGTAQTERNLSVSSAILYQLIAETENRKKQIDNYTNDLIRYRNQLDSLLSDPSIYAFPKDSAALSRYISRLRVIVRQGNPADNALNEALASSQDVQNDIDYLLYTLKASYEKIEYYRKELSYLTFKREFADIWDPVGYYRPFPEILRFSFAKERMAIQFYVRENRFKLFLLLCLVALVYTGVRSLKNKLQEEGQIDALKAEKLILRQPLAATLILVLSIYQFVFINAPFIFSFFIWLIEVICLFILLRHYITAYWLRFWIILSCLFLLVCVDNFVLQASRTERWIMAALSLAGILFGSYHIVSHRRHELKEQSIILFIRFLVVCEVLSLVLNVFGRYNLSKILLIAGYTGAVTAILFLWVVRLINEGLSLAAAGYKYPERKLFYINFNRVGSKVPAVLYCLLFAGWAVIVGRNFYAFKRLAFVFYDFLHKERALGNYNFSINGLFLFLLIITCSMVLSRIVSFFAADPQATHGNSSAARASKKVAIGSWILLVRIFIISLGLFLAFAAAGLPLDKITIVLGALSVGIGLGLQGLVSNLISGLILAFEKPVNVGDFIEVDGKPGMMKSIGFRSSTVLLGDGSSLVVPNGDLLNNHVINWSSGRSSRRIIVPVGVAYGSDLTKVKELLQAIADADERVLKSPAILAVPKGFGDNAILFDLIFWIKNQRDSFVITGDMIMAIDHMFKEAGIKIPFPQQEIHMYREAEDNNGAEGQDDK